MSSRMSVSPALPCLTLRQDARHTKGDSVVLKGHEPVFIGAYRAVRVVGTYVRVFVVHDRRAVTVQEVLIAQDAIRG